MLERGLAARKAKSVFFEERNSIDIYVEDTAIGYKKIYKCILNRLLGEDYLINDVFPLGGRGAVLTSWGSDENKRKRPRLYIIDGDIDLLHGVRECKAGLYTLPYYCIENIFVCEDAIVNLMVDEDPEKEKDELSALFDFNGWNEKNADLLFELFITYALIQKFTPSIQNVNYQISKLVSGNKGELDSVKVNERIGMLETSLRLVITDEVIAYEKKKIKSEITKDARVKKFVSGKDYLLPLLMTRVKSIVNTKISNINFKHRVSKYCDLNDLSDIKYSILP